MIAIRPANEGDLDWLVEELRKFDEFYKTKRSLFGNEVYVRQRLVEIMSEHVFLVADQEGEGIGFIAGIVKPHFYNPDIRVLTQLFWWVKPEFRRSIAAVALMDSFIDIGKKSADWITFSMAPQTPVSERSFERRGFVQSDKTYLLEVERG